VVLTFGSPILLNRIVSFVEVPGSPAWQGYAFAVLIAANTIVKTVVGQHYTYKMSRIGLRCRGGLSVNVFNKSIRLSQSSLLKVRTYT